MQAQLCHIILQVSGSSLIPKSEAKTAWDPLLMILLMIGRKIKIMLMNSWIMLWHRQLIDLFVYIILLLIEAVVPPRVARSRRKVIVIRTHHLELITAMTNIIYTKEPAGGAKQRIRLSKSWTAIIITTIAHRMIRLCDPWSSCKSTVVFSSLWNKEGGRRNLTQQMTMSKH